MSNTFREYVDWAGGAAKAAEQLGCSESLIYHVLNGRRNVSRNMANRVHEVSAGRFDRVELIFGNETAA